MPSQVSIFFVGDIWYGAVKIAGIRRKKKECLGCGQVLPFSEYGVDKGRADGYASKCRERKRVIANEKYAGNKIDMA